MIIRLKDSFKLFGIVIMCSCAALPCTLFMNSNKDMTRIKDLIATEQAQAIYDATIASGKMITAVSGGALALTTIVMLFFYIKHYIDAHKSELGILKALGYSNMKIAKGFGVFGFAVFSGTLLGFAIAYIMMPAFYREMRGDWELPDVPLHFNPELIIFLIVLPTLAFSLISILYSCQKLRRPALELIKGKSALKIMKAKNNSRDLPFIKELRQSTIKSRPSLVFFIGLASFCYSDMVQMSMGITDIASEMMAIMMLIIGLALAFTTLFIAATTVIKSNNRNIAMLKVFGYTDKECSYAILNGYRPAAIVGFIVGTGYQYGLMQIIIHSFLSDDAIDAIGYSFSIPALIIALVSFAFIYEGIMRAYGWMIRRIPLKQVMMEE